MFTNIKYDLARLLDIAKKDSISKNDIPEMNTNLGSLLMINLYYAREDKIDWELLLSILLEFVLFFEKYFLKDGKIKVPSIFQWPTIIKQLVELIKKVANVF